MAGPEGRLDVCLARGALACRHVLGHQPCRQPQGWPLLLSQLDFLRQFVSMPLPVACAAICHTHAPNHPVAATVSMFGRV